MTARSGGRPGLAITQVLLAVLFLAVIGATVGYLVGHNAKQRLTAGQTGDLQATATGDGGGATDTPTDGTGPTDTPTSTDNRQHCPSPAEQAAGESLYQILYMQTAHSEVWICRTSGGRLAYQGHSKDLGPDIIEGTTALFIWDPDKRDSSYYVATNTNAADGTITEYHVWPEKLVIKFRNYPTPKADQTEPATG